MPRYRFTLPIPPSANRYWRKFRNVIVLSPEAVAYKRDVLLRLKPSIPEPMGGNIGITLRVFRARRSGDLDNFAKCTLDSLNKIAYADDKQIIELHAYRADDPKDPRVEIEVWEITPVIPAQPRSSRRRATS